MTEKNAFILFQELSMMLDGMKEKLKELSQMVTEQQFSCVKESRDENAQTRIHGDPQKKSLTTNERTILSRTENLLSLNFVQSNNQCCERFFFLFMKNVISQLKFMGHEQTAENYIATFKSFSLFRKGKDILMDNINSEIMMKYEAYLRERGVTMNTISFYMRILRAVYNRGVDRGLTVQHAPFKHVYTGVEKTTKRAISLSNIRKIKLLDLSTKPSTLSLARDLFLFSFYTRGMSFVDMAFLKKADLKDGMISYRRKKTGQELFIKWEKCMQEIVDRHVTSSSSIYLLPIIKEERDKRRQYRNALRLTNRNLKEIASLIGLRTNLTMYVSRHSWASIAKSKNIPLSIISESMGHDTETTTRIYLSSLDNSVIDKANKTILSCL